MSMYVYNKISTKQGMVMHLNKTHIGMAYNHLDYHNIRIQLRNTTTQRNQIYDISANAHMLWHSQITVFIL